MVSTQETMEKNVHVSRVKQRDFSLRNTRFTRTMFAGHSVHVETMAEFSTKHLIHAIHFVISFGFFILVFPLFCYNKLIIFKWNKINVCKFVQTIAMHIWPQHVA